VIHFAQRGPRFESARRLALARLWHSWSGGVTLWSDMGDIPQGVDTQSPRLEAGERRIVSVLVSDIQRSTPIAEKLGPERYKLLFDEVTRLMRQEVERLGGTVAQLTGDGMLALFGAPTAHEDDAERAVNAALAIHDSLARYDADVGPAYGIELRARVAVNTGPVVVPAGDEPPERLYNALGDTVNVAARLEGIAGASGVCVGERTAQLLGETFELEPLGEVELKGISAPVSAFLVTGVGEVATGRPSGPLVGRERELGELEAKLEALLQGAGAVVSITGEPGIGKSRLLAEARERYCDRVWFLEGHAVVGGEERPYWSIRDLLRDWLGLGLSDPEARVRLELRAGLARTLGDEADEAYPFFATLLGLGLEGEAARRLEELSRDSISRQTIDWLLRLVIELSHKQPLCLAFEDLEAADEATLALLEELLNLTEEAPVALLLLHRSDPEHEAWHVVDRARRRHRHRFVELELGPLASQAARELAEARAHAELEDEVGDILVNRSGGNPFFLEEAVRDLIERGALVREDGRIRLAADFDRVAVPALVQEALQARFDRLSPSTRELLCVAAVGGRSFGLPLLERLVSRERLTPALAELQRLELVVEQRRQPAPEYRFRHGVVQEVAYATLTEARRRQLHLQLGEALEEIHRESPEEVYGALAHNFSQADEPARAAKYLLSAGDAARMVYAEPEALAYYRAALAFLERLGDADRGRETLFKMALTHHLAFGFKDANDAYREAFRIPPRFASGGQVNESICVAVSELTAEHLRLGAYAATETGWLAASLYRGLVRIDRELNVLPAVAERLQVSPEGRVYSFALDPRARWSDGSAVTAGDFVFSLERMREERAPFAHLLDDVEAVRAVDERTLEITLSQPRSYFLYLLADWWHPRPQHRPETAGGAVRAGDLVTNGPFRLDELDAKRARFVANPHWHGRRGNVGAVEILFLGGGPEPYIQAWLQGVTDIYFEQRRLERARRSVEAPHTVTEITPMLHVGFLHLRTRPPFDDVRVRQAFARAVDAEELLQRVTAERDLVPGHATAPGRGGLLPPTMPGHGHRSRFAHDLEEARRLLARAGYPNGRGLPHIDVTVYTEVLGPVIAEQFSRLGADVDVIVDPAQATALGGGEAHVTTQGYLADYPDPDGLLRPLNQLLFRDGEASAMLANAAGATDRDERLRLYQAIDTYLVAERAYAVPTLYGRAVMSRRPWIEGFWSNPVGSAPFDELVVRPELRP
jgi:ABC-type transport system substrate-binding protein/class 3 adenylate cyclase